MQYSNALKLNMLSNISAFIIVISLFIRQYKPAFSVAMIVFAIFFLLDYYENRRVRKIVMPEKVCKGIVVYFGAFLCVSILSFDVNNICETFNFISYSLPFFMLLYLSSENNILNSVKYALLTILIVGSAFGIYQMGYLHQQRINALLQGPTVWAAFMGLIMPLFFYPVLNSTNKKEQCFYCFISFLIIISIYATQTRGIMVPCIMCIAGLSVYVAAKKNKIAGAVLVLVCILGAAIIVGNLNRGYEYQRVYAWKAAIAMWENHPLLGIGIENWKDMYLSKMYFSKGATEHLPHAHNLFLQALATTGIVGLCGMVYFFYTTIKMFLTTAKNNNPYYYVAVVGLSIFLISSLLDSFLSIKYFVRIFWMIFFVYLNNIFDTNDNKT